VTLAEQLEDVRGEVTESIKQRKRERADLMNEMSHVAQRIDKGKEQYESINQLIQVLHKEINAIVKTMQIQHALDQQDDKDRE
jgi:DNA repair exonuclease SbcCD ATPase subunit